MPIRPPLAALVALLTAAGCAGADAPAPLSITLPPAPEPPPAEGAPRADASSIPRVVQLASIDTHACALVSDGRVMCWGQNSGGQLGTGAKGDWSESPPAFVAGITDATQVAVGAYHSCVIHRGGTVSCWGYLIAGDGVTHEGHLESALPVAIEGLTDVKQLALGIGHKCALAGDRRVWCWGENYAGALGDGTSGTRRTAPQLVAGLRDVTQLAAGDRYTCARHADATVSCWGENYFATLGDGTVDDKARPQRVPGLERVGRVVPMNEGWVCALHEEGTVSCWGRQLRYARLAGSKTRPQALAGLTGVSQLAGGGRAACARTGREVACWGELNEQHMSEAPATVAGVEVQEVAVRPYAHALLLRSDGAVVTAFDPLGARVLIDPAAL